ncbi:type II toxin-antitoxin system YafQ family toxin [Parasediminibacterium sp. JCM 36343]|uniref:type II toxin-antitoxin system RelE/ParE family toxin n=1 Tax=Parasediminibacterium sp. JCM 36343 TaxID=3374279 RepID=UPI00397E5614
MKIEFSSPYRKSFKKLISKNPDIVFEVFNKLLVLNTDINHPSLKLHKLKSELRSYHAISIEYDLRIIMEIKTDSVVLINIGKHDDVY